MGGGSGTLLVNDRASALLKNGFAFQRMGDYESAIENFTKALDSDPHSGEAHYGRGICHLQRGEFDRAIADFTRGSIETALSRCQPVDLVDNDDLNLPGLDAAIQAEATSAVTASHAVQAPQVSLLRVIAERMFEGD